jgi:B-box zinc finger
VSGISGTRCFNHARREAVARCTVCGTFFCRECIAEHNGRMICARCLLPGETTRGKRRLLSGVIRAFQLLGGVLLLWLVFFLMGRALLKLPTSFHDGSLWAPTESQR